MLIDELIYFCDEQFSSQDTSYICSDCTHRINCPRSCKKCLEEIHYPDKYPNGKRDYDCSNLINFYVCDYSYKYASEIWYLLKKSKTIKRIDRYNIMSIGCGGCPDLMAFESYIMDNNLSKQIYYIGVDKNKLWEPVHKQISMHKSEIIKQTTFRYVDAIEYLNTKSIKSANVLILQYIISHFYNTNQIAQINKFYDDLINRIVMHKQQNKPFVIIINDVNSIYRGRGYFLNLCQKLSEKGLQNTYAQYYFDYNIKNDKQRYGERHANNDVLYDVPNKLYKYDPWVKCSSAQLLIELD
jgi:hypothetical protein